MQKSTSPPFRATFRTIKAVSILAATFLRYSLAGASALALSPARHILDATNRASARADEFGVFCTVRHTRLRGRWLNHREPGDQAGVQPRSSRNFPKSTSMSRNIRRIETTFDTAVKTRISAGIETDLINLNGQFVVAWARSNLIYPLTDFPELRATLASIDPGALRVAEYNGVPYVVGVAATGGLAVTVLWYNRDLTSTVGMPDGPKTTCRLKSNGGAT